MNSISQLNHEGEFQRAWAYRYPAKVSRHLQRRIEKVPKPIQDISWKAQVRLCKRSGSR